MNTTACVARWRIRPVSSALEQGMPGVGFPRWKVELLKIRNGRPGSWDLEWSAGGFKLLGLEETSVSPQTLARLSEEKRKTG